MRHHGIDIASIAETHLRPEGKIRTDYFSFNATRTPPKEGRNSGGVSLLFRKAGGDRWYSSIQKRTSNIICQLGQIKIGVVYLSPASSRAETEKCLNMINTHARGKSILCGDWNSRHQEWDRLSNRKGNQLVRWASAKKWKVRTWEGYSFRTRQYKSNIDFFVTKGLDIGIVRSLNDVWTGRTQHRPIVTSLLTRK